MHEFRFWKLILPAICLAACSAGKDPEPAPPQKTVFDPLTQQIDRAQKVQVTVDEHAADTRKQVEATENGEASR
jgi:hypothetical protein